MYGPYSGNIFQMLGFGGQQAGGGGDGLLAPASPAPLMAPSFAPMTQPQHSGLLSLMGGQQQPQGGGQQPGGLLGGLNGAYQKKFGQDFGGGAMGSYLGQNNGLLSTGIKLASLLA